MGGRVLSCLPIPRGPGGGLQPPQSHTLATWSGSGAGEGQGRAGKPQSINKMEKDASRAAPGEGLIYERLGLGHPSAPRGAHAVGGGINSALLATGVKDALRMGHLLLCMVKVPAGRGGGSLGASA